jgi:hypothetical protein
MAKALPYSPSLEHLKKQARALQSAHRKREPEAARLIQAHHPKLAGQNAEEIWNRPFSLADAQVVLARDYGFPSWPRLKWHVEQQARPVRQHWVEAVIGGDLEGMRALLRADPTLTNSLHVELDDPYRTKRFPVATLLYAAAGPPCQTDECWAQRPDHHGSVAMVRLLVEAGADVNVHSHHGLPLCWVSDPQIAAYLMEHGALVNRWHENGGSPLYFTTWQADPQRMKMLLELGADPNGSDPETGETCMHTSAMMLSGRANDCLKLLLEAGADPNVRCHVDPRKSNPNARKVWPDVSLVGETPLHRAALLGTGHTIEQLLQHGADRDRETAMGETPIDRARRAERGEGIVNLL